MANRKTETVRHGNKARYPYTSEYVEPTSEQGLTFVGWKYGDNIFPPPFNNEAENPFGPINADTTIMAMWSRLFVYCFPEKETMGYEGGNLKIYYYAVTSSVVTSNDVHLTFIAPSVDPISYTVVSDVVDSSGNYRVRTINIAQNSTDKGKTLYVKADYNGVESSVAEIYQQSVNEIVIPDCDYFHFTYSWEDNNNGGGTDLDSLTVIYVEDGEGNRIDKSFTGKSVGFGCNGQHIYETSEYVVKASNGQFCLKHGGDCRTSGAETVVCCLTNIAETGEISNLETIKIYIYANWYGMDTNVTTGGNMAINCRAYKSKNPNGPNFDTDINTIPREEVISTGPRTYNEYVVNTNNCEEVWSESVNFHVNAHGSSNAHVPIACAGEIYSNIGTVVYTIGRKQKTFVKRSVDNGVDRSSDTKQIYFYDDNGRLSFAYTISIGSQDRAEHTISGLYINYWTNNVNLYTQPNDSVNIYLYNNSNAEIDASYRFKITEDMLGQEFGVNDTKFFEKFKVVKRADGKVDITFKLKEYANEPRSIELEVNKYFSDCTPKLEHYTFVKIKQSTEYDT